MTFFRTQSLVASAAAFARPSCLVSQLPSFWVPPKRRRHPPTRASAALSSSNYHIISQRPRRCHCIKRPTTPTLQLMQQHSQQSTRLFGSKPNSPNAKPGHVLLSDDRDNPSAIPIDLSALRRTIEITRDIIGYPTYDVSLSLVDDDYMREVNMAARGVDSPTDVLSFCFQEKFIEPGVLGEVQFDVADFYNLGDMLIDVDYVKRRCEEDAKVHKEEGRGRDDVKMQEGEVISEHINSDGGDGPHQNEEEEGEYEYIEVEVDEYDDRGVAPAMQFVYDAEIRTHMLIVHGILHLVGYDHIEDDDYELMVVREDEILGELKRRLGDNFGVAARALP